MRYILLAVSLAALAGWSLNTTVTSDATVSASVQDTVRQLKLLHGVCTVADDKITAVSFTDGSALKPETFTLFAALSDLESLQIANYRELSDDDVARLTGLKKIKTLKLANGGITDAAVKTIADAFPLLVNLDLSSETRLTDDATKDIARLKNLETLSMLFCGISEFGIMNIATLPKLKALDIRAANVGNSGLSALAGVKTLKSLKHRAQTVTDEGIQALVGAKEISNLEIQDFSITGQSGQFIRQMENLTSLIIFRCENFDSSGLTELKGLKLNRLTLRGLPVDDGGLEVFRGLPTLKKLYLDELPSVSDIGVMNLVYLKELETLEIWDVPITDKSLETIAKLPKLKTLILRSTGITDAGLLTLQSISSLTELTIQDNAKVTPAAVQKLKEAKKFNVK
ncbi:MAG: hypothetical protein LBT89_11840 [Planctomycetaceae bacterium]|jgi:hypothetical protein|nr:hypothetical protein [Planctomycetaceae bacterium]